MNRFYVDSNPLTTGGKGTGGIGSMESVYANGSANGIDMVTKIDWVAHKVSWLTNGCMKAGAVIRENGGIVEIVYNATA